MNKNKMNNLVAGGKKLALIAMLAAMPLANVCAQESADRTDNTITMSFELYFREHHWGVVYNLTLPGDVNAS